ncbi:MAG: hypothetical protein DMG48_03705 [Acidobacteria bacterium]|nr:MAG: hypothetical protein DMG48_03705 [Acidobacteriota bacterium]
MNFSKRSWMHPFVLTFAVVVCVVMAQDQLPQYSMDKGSPTVVRARRFLENAESRLFGRTNKAQRASWVEENFITDDTEQIAAEANQELNTFSAEMSKKAHEFDKLTLPPEICRPWSARKLTSIPAPNTMCHRIRLT